MTIDTSKFFTNRAGVLGAGGIFAFLEMLSPEKREALIDMAPGFLEGNGDTVLALAALYFVLNFLNERFPKPTKALMIGLLVLGLSAPAMAGGFGSRVMSQIGNAEKWSMENATVIHQATDVPERPGWKYIVIQLPGDLGGRHAIYCPAGDEADGCSNLPNLSRISTMSGYFENIRPAGRKMPVTALVVEMLRSNSLHDPRRRGPGKRHSHQGTAPHDGGE